MDIHQLINRYFDGATTVDEERQLRQMLAQGEYCGEDVDEARAVMGVSACRRVAARKQARASRRKRAEVAARAACVALLLVGGIYAATHHRQQPQLVAYINGVEVAPDAVRLQMQADFSLFYEVSAEVSDAIADDFLSMSVIFQ